jgi:hypothetical protein
LREGLPGRLARGARVLKQYRGHSGMGVWRVQAVDGGRVALRHAQRGAVEEEMAFDEAVAHLAPYFTNDDCTPGHMVDQAWQRRLEEGMIRAYLVRDRVGGFGHQAINALYPAKLGELAPPAGPRLYSEANDPRFQELRRHIEQSWVADLCARTGLAHAQLPMLWDMDFMFGERGANGASDSASVNTSVSTSVSAPVGFPERYVLCEINVSSVSPFPPSAVVPLVQATVEALAWC